MIALSRKRRESKNVFDLRNHGYRFCRGSLDDQHSRRAATAPSRFGTVVKPMITLTWRKHQFDGLGEGFILEGLPNKDDNGCARPHAALHYIAIAHIGKNFMSHDGKTLNIAMNRLNSEISRRFGDKMRFRSPVPHHHCGLCQCL